MVYCSPMRMCDTVLVAGVLSLASLMSFSSLAARGDTLPSEAADNPVAFVDPFTGTAGTGHTHPAACVPFGMVQAGPDTGPETGDGDWVYCSGYQFGDASILGYSLTHLSGTGCVGYNDVEILPFMGEPRAMPMRSAIDKATEKAEPGFYRVAQPADGVETEIAAAKRAALYRFTWAKAGTANILVNFRPPAMRRALSDVAVTAEGATTLTGRYVSRVWLGAPRVAFAFTFSKPWTAWRELPKEKPTDAPRYLVSFAVTAGEQLLLKAGLALTDEAGARANLAADLPDWDVARVRAAARARWNVLLARTTCDGSVEQKRLWYTALYHLYVQPNDFADVDGRYRAANGRLAQSVDGTSYTTLSLWDTFRAAHPWYTIATPEIVAPVVNSCLAHYREKGRLPVLSYGGKVIDCMIGNHAVPVIVDAYLKGLRGFDAALAFEAITNTLTVAHADNPKENWDLYDRHGYYPFDRIKGESVSRTLECSYDDWCAAVFARALGQDAAAAFFDRRAGFWKNVFDPSVKFARGRDTTGAWRTPFDPYAFGHGPNRANDFTEGNAFQYTWHVLQDVPGLVAAMGGRDAFVATLDRLFQAPMQTAGASGDITGMIGQYVHGNEPSHHVIYFYPQVGEPAKAAERIREVIDAQYHIGPEGLCGNDDCGQMSAWYVFSALGFYPFNPCGGEYVIGAPQIPAATLRFANGKTFMMTAKNLSKANKYVKSVTLNGRPVSDWKIRHADIVKGGSLVFEMTERAPSTVSGAGSAGLSPRATDAKTVFTVAADRPDCRYDVGAKVVYTVTATDEKGAPLKAGKVTWSLDNFGSDVIAPRTEVDLAAGNPFRVEGSLPYPGFLRLNLKAANGSSRVWSVAVAPERVKASSPRPADFDTFWDDAMAKLEREVPLDPQLERVEEKSQGAFDYYNVSFATFGGRVYGFFTAPKDRSKKYPALMTVPGAGPYHNGSWYGSDKRVSLMVNVLPFKPDRDNKTFTADYEVWEKAVTAKFGVHGCYGTAGIAVSREAYVYYSILLGINRAVNWLAERPEVDRTRIGYYGGSQGGAFGYFLLGLNRNFARGAMYVPAMAEHLAWRQKRQPTWPALLSAQPAEGRAEAEKNAPYFDIVHFAPRIRVPVRTAVGLSDTTCPPAGGWCAFNALASPDKRMTTVPGMTHKTDSTLERDLFAWVCGM